MKRKIYLILLTMVALAVLVSCTPAPTQSPADQPQTQPESPTEAPYPAPEEADSTEEQTPVDDSAETEENAYPEPAEPGFVVVPSEHEYSPQPGDDKLTRGEVQIDSSEILLLESFPVQVRLHLVGNLPTPCHALRAVVSPPDDENRIQVEAYSLIDPDQICTQVLEPFEADIPLGNYTEGEFTVWVNEEKSGEFKLP